MTPFLSSHSRLRGLLLALVLFLPLILWMISHFKLLLHDDMVFLLFAVINSRDFCMPHHRYPDALTQVFPLILTHWHAPLKIIAGAFLVNLGLFYTAMGCLSVVVTKSRFPLYVLGLLVYAGFMEIIYWPISDVALGYGALVPVAAFLLNPDGRRDAVRWWQPLIAMTCLLIALFFHPSVVLGVFGLLVLSILEARRFDWRHGLSLVMLPGYFIYKYRTVDAYESGHLSISEWNDGSHAGVMVLLTEVLPLYLPLLALSFYALWFAMKTKGPEFWILLACLGGASLYFLGFYVPAHNFGYAGLYRCNLLIPVTFFLAVGACYVLFKQRPDHPPSLLCFLVGATAFSVATIHQSTMYQQKNDLTLQVIAKARAEHVTLAYIRTGPSYVDWRMGWSISLDTMIWSMLKGPGEKVSVVQESTLRKLYGPGYLNEHEHFAAGSCVQPVKFRDLNPDYFSFETTTYRPISIPGP